MQARPAKGLRKVLTVNGVLSFNITIIFSARFYTQLLTQRICRCFDPGQQNRFSAAGLVTFSRGLDL